MKLRPGQMRFFASLTNHETSSKYPPYFVFHHSNKFVDYRPLLSRAKVVQAACLPPLNALADVRVCSRMHA